MNACPWRFIWHIDILTYSTALHICTLNPRISYWYLTILSLKLRKWILIINTLNIAYASGLITISRLFNCSIHAPPLSKLTILSVYYNLLGNKFKEVFPDSTQFTTYIWLSLQYSWSPLSIIRDKRVHDVTVLMNCPPSSGREQHRTAGDAYSKNNSSINQTSLLSQLSKGTSNTSVFLQKQLSEDTNIISVI